MSETYVTTRYYIEAYLPDHAWASEDGWVRCFDTYEQPESCLANAREFQERWNRPHRVVRVTEVVTETVLELPAEGKSQ